MNCLNDAHVDEKSRQLAESGMRVEGVDWLNPGAVLYRFVQRADVRDDDYICSPWWFQVAAVRKVLQAARAGHRGEDAVAGQAARMAALSASWLNSGANYLLAARVAAPVRFFWGSPRAVGLTAAGQQTASGLGSGAEVAQLEVVPDPRCVQLFVPGVHKDNPSLARKIFRVRSRTRFKHDPDLVQGDIEVFLQRLSS